MKHIKSRMAQTMEGMGVQAPNVNAEDDSSVSHDGKGADDDEIAKDATNSSGTIDDEIENSGNGCVETEANINAENDDLNAVDDNDDMGDDEGKVKGKKCEDDGAKDA